MDTEQEYRKKVEGTYNKQTEDKVKLQPLPNQRKRAVDKAF